MTEKKAPGVSPDKPFNPATLGAAPERGPLRDASDDSRARAAARMAELRGLHGDQLVNDGVDKFSIDRSIIPDGWDYEWKRLTLLNKEDPSYQVELARAGWEFVPTKRHPHLMPFGTAPDSPITRDGNALMERPMELTEEARRAARRAAHMQVRIKEEQLAQAPAPGHFERNNKGASMASVNKSYVPMPVPE